jgi:hypothetical protein
MYGKGLQYVPSGSPVSVSHANIHPFCTVPPPLQSALADGDGCANTDIELCAAHHHHGFEPFHVAILKEEFLRESLIVGQVTSRDEQHEIDCAVDVVAIFRLASGQ